ncbi:hypothetical protein P4278_09340 [Bacillus thuringiensis]|uniref:hypothetical protein n=1 Tax=Bacillus paranthracis TaxID=2026186 RepID=UPI0013D2C399|nr:hypothetical protein [Bacillus paranthracis]MCU5712635.1 hypothetical protein [Bacillus cereus]MED2749759.1 hypothetical protein [Bacillus thuringiensis]MCU5298390.1 hypothetical protein [Bacillus paranthracis]MEC2498154.1 hypothetical protein [Bacillus cereus]MED2754839.1 hypothetical protein [Bacillus thuringiensis]
MNFLQNFSVAVLFVVLIMGIVCNALYELIKHVVQYPKTSLAEIGTLPQVTILQWSIIVILAVVVMYILIKLYNRSR